jgi:hypothetical protein
MQLLTMIKTLDGLHHKTEADARRHLDKLYADELLKHARNLAQQNYTFTSEYIDANLDGFARLKEIKNDFILTNDDPENWE